MRRPFLFIFLSTLIISGTAWGLWGLQMGWKYSKSIDPRYTIRAIVSKPIASERLMPAILAEWLDLSTSKGRNLYRFNLEQARVKLESQPPVKKVALSRLPPSSLLVEVELRKPMALMGDRTNTAISEEGVLFSLVPYYTPKKLPRLFLGSRDNFPLAKDLLHHFERKGRLDKVDLIDVEKSQSSSYGDREVIIRYDGIWMRIEPDHWQEGIDKFFKVKHIEAKIVDLRIRGLAIITPKDKANE